MMNIIGCLDRPTRGIFSDGVDVSTVNKPGLADIRNKNVGFVFQSSILFRGLAALENVRAPGWFMPASAEASRARRARAACRK